MFVDAGHVALQVPDVESSLVHYTEVLGLRELARREDAIFLSHGLDRPCVQLIRATELAFDHVAYEVADQTALEQLRERLDAAGVEVADGVDEPGVLAGIRFEGPTGHVYEAVVQYPSAEPDGGARAIRGDGYPSRGVRPNRLGHVTLQTADVPANIEFMTNTLGFRLSDLIVEDEPWMAFGRCNNDHHALAFMRGRDALHHFAFEVSSVGELARLGDTLYEAGRQILWGPGRHGAGDNIAMYHQDPAGVIVEYYTDMQRILDERWQPRHWKLDDYRFNNVWGGPMPSPELIDAVVPCATREQV